MKAPFPYLGGKGRVAAEVWRRFGRIGSYVEPFFGSGAVLLARPAPCGVESVNDLDGLLVNAWRAIRSEPEALFDLIEPRVSELDLHARLSELCAVRQGITDRLRDDPRFFDLELGAWWLWGAAQWIGGGWCARPSRQIPLVPGERTGGGGVLARDRASVRALLLRLRDRLERVGLFCGEWERLAVPAARAAAAGERVGIFLDPPYDEGAGYAAGGGVSGDVWRWATEAAERAPGLRLAVCGYEDGRELPEGWEALAWKASGGFCNVAGGVGWERSERERIWFSPACREEAAQVSLFEALA